MIPGGEPIYLGKRRDGRFTAFCTGLLVGVWIGAFVAWLMMLLTERP